LAAFEWSSDDVNQGQLGNLSMEEAPMDIAVITREKPPPPIQEPPKQELEKVLLELIVVDNKKDVEKIDWNSELKNRNSPTIVIPSDVIIIDEKPEPIPWHEVKDKPEYPGGEKAMFKFIQKNSIYPAIPKENGVEGKVYVQFVIDETGKVINPVIKKGVDTYLDAEAIRVVSLFPRWKPGKQRDIPVPVTFILPINFNLE
jgi:protein TonB